jgi:hypothetical protein
VGVGELPAPPPVALGAGVVEASLLLLLLLSLLLPLAEGVAAGVEGAGGSDVGSFDGGGLLVLEGSDGDSVDDAGGGAGDDEAGGGVDEAGGGADDEGGATDGVEAPVPSASCLLPWWMY